MFSWRVKYIIADFFLVREHGYGMGGGTPAFTTELRVSTRASGSVPQTKTDVRSNMLFKAAKRLSSMVWHIVKPKKNTKAFSPRTDRSRSSTVHPCICRYDLLSRIRIWKSTAPTPGSMCCITQIARLPHGNMSHV